MPKPSDDVQDLKRSLARLARLEGRPLACAEGLVLFEPVRVHDPRPLLAACEAGPPPAAAVAASIELASPPLVLTVGLLAAATRDLRILQEPRTRAALKEAPRIFRRYGDLDDARLSVWRATLARLAERLHAASAEVPWFTRVLEAIGLAHGDEAPAVVERALAGLGGGARARERARRFLAGHALAFDPRPRRGGELALGARDVERGLDALDERLARFGAAGLRLDEVMVLGALKLDTATDPAVRLVAAGLPVEKVRRLAELDHASDLKTFAGEPEIAAAYADWASALVPHYAALGLDVPLTPEVFEHLRKATRREDLGVLAVCLMKHHARASADSAGEALARLDATLGLFQRRPDEAASILAELSGTSPGAGREALPEVAAWLGDDALLDRYVHLARVAGVPVALSRALRADFDRAARLAGERAHLAALPSPTPEQAERLRRLSAGEVAPPDPARTRRRLSDRLDDLTARAYERRLDAVFRGILKQVFRISLARLTPAWRDAIRFYLAVKKNRELTGTVLRAAAGGVDLARTLPRNRAWIDEVSARMDTGAWLAPRAREVTLAGRVHRLAVEHDPVEVLRMGIPFGTCLSLDEGVNAASTVINAADANKRVLYLRDPEGSIVARKLVAVSEEGALVGYQLYVAAGEHREAIGAAFHAFCIELAAAARLPLASEGEPRQIHAGFWYDDGTVPFEGLPEDAPVKAYCRSLGLPPPAAADEGLLHRARLFGALRHQDEAAVAATLRDFWRRLGLETRAADWLLARLEGAELIAAARRSSVLSTAAVARAAAEGPGPMLALAARIANTASAAEAVEQLLRLPRTAAVAYALVKAALATLPHAEENDGHGLDHKAADHLQEFAGALPVAAALSLCDRAEPLFRALTRRGCANCAATAEHRLFEAIELSYASARDPDAVLHCLGSARASLLASRAALRVAARYALVPDGALPSLPPPRLQPLHPCPPALRALAKLRARAPDLDAHPDMLAALLRQAAGVPRDVKLPVPREAPFDSLGDLLIQLDLAEVLARWSGADGATSTWKPSPWELYHHRRHRTGRRAALVAEIMGTSPPPASAAFLLARLGDVATLSAASRASPPRARNKTSGKLALARLVAAQVEACRAPDPLAAAALLPPGALAETLDPGLVAAALARIEDRLSGAVADMDMEPALSIAVRREVREGTVFRAAARLAALGALSEPEHAFLARFLRVETQTWGPERAPDLALAFGPVASLRDDLAVALCNLDDFAAAYPAVEAALARAGHAGVMDALLPAWVSATMAEKKEHELCDTADEALFRRMVRVLVDERRAGDVLALYREVHVPEQAAIVLDELGRSPLRASPEMGEALRAMEHWMKDADNAALAGWLGACVGERG